MLKVRLLSSMALTGAAAALALVFLHACEDPGLQPTDGTRAFAAATQALTVQGTGTGSGAVTAPAAGGAPALNCVITGGVAAATGCLQSYVTGATVTLTAVPADGNGFAGWGGGCTGVAPCVKTMSTARTVKAQFVPLSLLTVTGGGTGNGTVTSQSGLQPAINCTITAGRAGSTDCSAAYGPSVVVTLTASPAPGSAFTGWGGGCSGTGPCQKTMNVARTVKANFKTAATYSVTLGGSGSGTVTSQAGLTPGLACTLTDGAAGSSGCTASYPSGTVVTLTPTPASGFVFTGWGGVCDSAGSNTSCSLTVSGPAGVSATFALAGSPAPEASQGKWSAPFATPIIAIHAALTLDGRAMLWGLNGQPWTWDPASLDSNPAGGFVEKAVTSTMFCGGHSYLSDGRMVVIGGEIRAMGNGYGIPDVNAFDTSSWSTLPRMLYARWYPTATTLADGQMLAIAGTDENNVTVPVPEVYDGSSWHALTGAQLALPFYPRTFVEPKRGLVFYAGENPISRYLDPAGNGGTGAWISAGTRLGAASRGYGSAVMLDGKVLYVGGGGGTCPSLPTETAELIDLNAATPAWRWTESMRYRRRQTNATILADGTVLVTGGTSACGFDDPSGSIYAAELWNPATEHWSVMASEVVRRIYHSTAILLPDARVLVAGGNDQFTAEIYAPPYLFNTDGSLAPRPSFTLTGSTFGYGQQLTLQTGDAASIAKATLIRFGAATHASNQSQQLNTLPMTAAGDGQSVSVQLPGAGRLAPPGPYLLFLVNQNGVPSVGRILTLR